MRVQPAQKEGPDVKNREPSLRSTPLTATNLGLSVGAGGGRVQISFSRIKAQHNILAISVVELVGDVMRWDFVLLKMEAEEHRSYDKTIDHDA
jgi:hypothetical protein